MISITKIYKSITKYLKLGKENSYIPKFGCGNCGFEGMLHRHGYYSRNVITKYNTYRIQILRIKCPACNKTYSLLPSFLIPYYQYSFDFIFNCLYNVYVLKQSYSTIINKVRKLNYNSNLNDAHITNFKKRYKNNLHIIKLFFACYDNFYYDMNNTSEAAVIEKIKNFIQIKDDFNYTYFMKMPKYFFAKI